VKAMILAAGLGTRMAPLARDVAKPALPVLDVPVIARLARTLATQGVRRLVINTHAHPDSLRRALAGEALPIDWVHETELRGSGGGVRGARTLLEDGPFLVLNGDMCLDLDVAALAARHRERGALLTLLLRDDPRQREFGSIGYDANGDVRRITERVDLGGEKSSGLFAGVQLMEPAILSHMPALERFEIIPELWLPLLREGGRIASVLQERGARWWPVGSPRELLDANLAALASEAADAPSQEDRRAAVSGEVVAPCWLGAGATVAAGACVGPRAIVSAGAHVGAGARLVDALALPGARVAPGADLRRAVAWGDEVWRDG
jgi:mannose-1-phosphate guanylyltransferase